MMLTAQIAAIRASAAATVAQCDALLQVLASHHDERAARTAREPCQHPLDQRTLSPRMGATGAWVCACGAEGGT